MLPDMVSNPGPLTYESGALPTALRGPARSEVNKNHNYLTSRQVQNLNMHYARSWWMCPHFFDMHNSVFINMHSHVRRLASWSQRYEIIFMLN